MQQSVALARLCKSFEALSCTDLCVARNISSFKDGGHIILVDVVASRPSHRHVSKVSPSSYSASRIWDPCKSIFCQSMSTTWDSIDLHRAHTQAQRSQHRQRPPPGELWSFWDMGGLRKSGTPNIGPNNGFPQNMTPNIRYPRISETPIFAKQPSKFDSGWGGNKRDVQGAPPVFTCFALVSHHLTFYDVCALSGT